MEHETNYDAAFCYVFYVMYYTTLPIVCGLFNYGFILVYISVIVKEIVASLVNNVHHCEEPRPRARPTK